MALLAESKSLLREFKLAWVNLLNLTPIQRQKNWNAVTQNQKQIIQSVQQGEQVLLKPVPPIGCGGKVDHYYHFIADLVLPLQHLCDRAPNIELAIEAEEVGLFAERLSQLFPQNIQILDTDSNVDRSSLNAIELIGMNPKCVSTTTEVLERFKAYVCSKLEVDLSGQPNKLLLIERLPPDNYFFSQTQIKGSGASRRSIVNHADLRALIEPMVQEPLELCNVRLEKMSFEEQIYSFDKAAVVIAQHGAGLINGFWMRPETVVIELNYDGLNNHFRTISGLKKQHYFWYKTNSHHATVDIKDFKEWLLSHSLLRQYFKS
ncbi:MAG: glycosyltransferase family 61 protein [Cyanobacteria bacterium J06642_2]